MRLGDFFVCTSLLDGGPHLDKADLFARLLTLLVSARRLRDEEFCRRVRQVGSAEELADLIHADGGGLTRRDWLACKEPQPMLRFLLGLRPDQLRVQDVESFPFCKGSDRKLRLFACA